MAVVPAIRFRRGARRGRLPAWHGVVAALALAGAGCGDAAEPPAFSADSVMVHVGRQLSFGPRVPGSAARDSAAVYLAGVLRRAGATVSVQSFEIDDPYSERPLRLFNLTGSFAPGKSPRVLLAAHYDSRPWADQEADTTLWSRPVPAGVDGACASAILLEIARIVGARAPDVGVDVVFFDGEDYGKAGDVAHYLLGSKHFAATLGGYRPACAVLLDMVGGAGTRVRREGFSREQAPRLVEWVFGRAAALGLDYFEATDGAPMYDDHVPLLQAGIPTIDLFGYDYAAWHTLRDDASQCDRAKIQQVGVLLRDLVYRFDFSPR
jgi:hypothetical protein